jgi:hypothetical protein
MGDIQQAGVTMVEYLSHVRADKGGAAREELVFPARVLVVSLHLSRVLHIYAMLLFDYGATALAINSRRLAGPCYWPGPRYCP